MVIFDENNNVIERQSFRAILAGLETKEDITYYMEELKGLVEAAGGEVLGLMTQSLEKPNSKTLIGPGKVLELSEMADTMEADTIIFNGELTGIQLRNLEDLTGKKVIDRTILILDIFAERASSKEGKLQVELAQLRYRLPRLTGFGKSLSRQGGGIGTRGPGEKKIETDRRHIESRILDIRRELKHLESIRTTQRSKRTKGDVPIVALVGYTNVGKSAIMNYYLNSFEKKDKKVTEENMLFATLDAKHRSLEIDNQHQFILVDTVGFVSKLPHNLIEAFKSTLEETKYADLIIHVVDYSYENYGFQIDVTEKVLQEIGAGEKETIFAYNKIDLVQANNNSLEYGDCPTKEVANKVFISAKEGINMDGLLKLVKSKIFDDLIKVNLLIPYEKGSLANFLCENAKVNSMDYVENGIAMDVEIKEKDLLKVKEYAVL